MPSAPPARPPAAGRRYRNDSTLKALSPSAGLMSPVFTPHHLAYTINVPPGTQSVELTPAAHDAGATVYVQGEAVAPGAASRPLPVGKTVQVLVRSADPLASTVYAVDVKALL